MRIVTLTSETKQNLLENLLKRSTNDYGEYEKVVAEIIEQVKSRKEEAIFEYSRKFDKCELTKETFEVTRAEIEEAYTQIDAHFIEVMKASAANIRAYHEKQKRNSWFDAKEDGTILGQKITPHAQCWCICSWWKSCISFHYTDERSTCQGCRCSQYYHDYSGRS